MSWFTTMQAIKSVIGDALTDALAADPPPVFDSTPAVVIMPGDSAWDQCPRVSVFLGNVDFRQNRCAVSRSVEYRIRMTVCISGDPKTKVSTWETEAQKLYDLTEIVLRAVTSNLETLFGSCETVTVQQLQSLQPSGGQAGVEFGVLTS